MLTYIKEIATSILKALGPPPDKNVFQLIRALSEELDRLDPRDFSPDVRFAFVSHKMAARTWASANSFTNSEGLKKLAGELPKVLDGYGLRGRGPQTREFRWLSDQQLKDIVSRDYAELNQILVPDGAWKSAVVLAGSILEAILLDLLTKDSARLAAAKASATAPKKNGAPKHEDEWTLHEMIQVAVAIALMPADRAKTFDQVLRDYRNFVHPRKEFRSAHPCGEGEALMAKGALDAFCDHLDRTLPR
ncbi:hypothetical protein AB3662_27185 [Sorangium cellulosum]|uniref:hypothetical protein n=1 Tax=Sorangium cellulosum TaxID=56 RepID=UPI003D9A69C5